MAARSKRERRRTPMHMSSSCSQMRLTERAERASCVASTPQETSRVGRGAPKLLRSAPLTLRMLSSWSSNLSDIHIVMPSFLSGYFPSISFSISSSYLFTLFFFYKQNIIVYLLPPDSLIFSQAILIYLYLLWLLMYCNFYYLVFSIILWFFSLFFFSFPLELSYLFLLSQFNRVF